MPGKILMPKLGLTMTEGVLAEWNVAKGSEVNTGDIIFSVETDKIITEVEARAGGQILEILVEEGEEVPVGAVVAYWTGPTAAIDTDDDVQPKAPEELESADSGNVSPTEPLSGNQIKASPSAKRLAKKHGVDLADIKGSGPRGRIKAADIETYLSSQENVLAESEEGDSPFTSRPANRLEKFIAGRLQTSKQSIPHFYVQAACDVSAISELRRVLKETSQADRVPSINDFVLLAVARALGNAPHLNAVWVDDEIREMRDVDVGMVVDTDQGLHVPILRDVLRMDIDQVAEASRHLAQRARAFQLGLDEMEGGAISVSNVGMFGSVVLVPIINLGQSAIVGVGGPSPIFRPDDDGNPRVVNEMPLVLACDHRIYDGIQAAKLLAAICEFLGNPETMLSADP